MRSKSVSHGIKYSHPVVVLSVVFAALINFAVSCDQFNRCAYIFLSFVSLFFLSSSFSTICFIIRIPYTHNIILIVVFCVCPRVVDLHEKGHSHASTGDNVCSTTIISTRKKDIYPPSRKQNRINIIYGARVKSSRAVLICIYIYFLIL